MNNESAKKFKSMLINMDESIDIGGWRHWLEDGGGAHAESLLAAMKLSGVGLEKNKTLKVLLKIFEALMSQGLTSEKARNQQAMVCISCGGREVLDDDSSECPTCQGEGVVWVGAIVKRDAWLLAMSETYLKISKQQRLKDVQNWCNFLNGGSDNE